MYDGFYRCLWFALLQDITAKLIVVDYPSVAKIFYFFHVYISLMMIVCLAVRAQNKTALNSFQQSAIVSLSFYRQMVILILSLVMF